MLLPPTNKETKKNKIIFNYDPTIEDYIGKTNHGLILSEVHPWVDVVWDFKNHGDVHLTDKYKYCLTKDYKEIKKFIDYFQINTTVTERSIWDYHFQKGQMIKEIDLMKKEYKLDGKYFHLLLINSSVKI